MEFFWVVSLFHVQLFSDSLEELEDQALNNFEAMGVEEYSLSEAEVDALLGERSYSGGDLPMEVLEEVEQTLASRPRNIRFFFTNEDSANSFFQFIRERILSEVQLEKCPQEDWNAEWKKHYSPIPVNERLEIIPSWYEKNQSQNGKQLSIYPGMGFGTGSHETTFLCLKLFSEDLESLSIDSVLDFGSGSGILGLASLLFFPNAEVDFYDIDPEANKNCYKNAELNDLTSQKFRLLLPEVRDYLKKNYDLVFANILESILIAEKDALVNYIKPNGHIILSGLLKHQVPGIVEIYSRAGLKLVKQLEKGDWAALLFKRESTL
jgi:ribosomal protein L11 methyltransferase